MWLPGTEQVSHPVPDVTHVLYLVALSLFPTLLIQLFSNPE